jgi:hypothetical protein
VSGSVKSASAPSSKKIKTTLSTCSVSQDIASQDAANDDHASTVRSDFDDSDDSDLEIVKVNPEKELGTSLNTFVERS